jgi:hypothetical protein
MTGMTMWMSMRRFTRLTNAFSKKVENLRAAVSLHFAHYNFMRVHRSLRVTPAMEARVSDRLWSLDELVERTSFCPVLDNLVRTRTAMKFRMAGAFMISLLADGSNAPADPGPTR